MSLEGGRVCASCGTRNKPRWEFCVRCGESLLDDAPSVTGRASVEAPGGSGEFPWRGLLLGALLLGGTVVAFAILRRGPGAPPSPELFTIATPASAPAAIPSPGPPRDVVAGQRMLAAGNLQAAIPLLAAAVEQDPDNLDLLKLYASTLRRAGQLEAAVGPFRRVVSVSDDPAAGLELARTLDLLGRDEEAAAAYADVLRISPRNGDGLGLLAGLHTRAGRHADALPLLQRLSELKPGDLGVRQNLAFAMEKTGNEPGAIETYTKILAEAPTANIARGRLAAAIARQGDKARAEALFREGIALEPTVPALHRSLGDLLEQKGSYAEAALAYREYARLAPNNPDAKSLVERAERLEKRRASAS